MVYCQVIVLYNDHDTITSALTDLFWLGPRVFLNSLKYRKCMGIHKSDLGPMWGTRNPNSQCEVLLLHDEI